MAILGVLLLLGVVGVAVAVAWANQDAIVASAGTLDVFGQQVNLTVVELFLIGAAAGAVVMIALSMTVGGTRRRMSRNAQRRRDQRELQARLAEANAAAATSSGERAAAREEVAAHR